MNIKNHLRWIYKKNLTMQIEFGYKNSAAMGAGAIGARKNHLESVQPFQGEL